MRSRQLLGLSSGGVASSARAVAAAPAVFEPFVYGTNSGSLGGASGGTGVTGTWTVGAGYDFSPALPTGNSYVYPGLSVGSTTPTSGGTGALDANAPATGAHVTEAFARRPLNATLTGTVYGSYLYQNVALAGVRNYAGLTIGPDPTAPGYGGGSGDYGYYIGGTDFNSFNTPGYGEIDAGNTSQTLAGLALVTRTTYDVLFQLNNVGLTTYSERTATAWILSAAQVDHFAANGGLTAAALNAAPLAPPPRTSPSGATATASPPPPRSTPRDS